MSSCCQGYVEMTKPLKRIKKRSFIHEKLQNFPGFCCCSVKILYTIL